MVFKVNGVVVPTPNVVAEKGVWEYKKVFLSDLSVLERVISKTLESGSNEFDVAVENEEGKVTSTKCYLDAPSYYHIHEYIGMLPKVVSVTFNWVDYKSSR